MQARTEEAACACHHSSWMASSVRKGSVSCNSRMAIFNKPFLENVPMYFKSTRVIYKPSSPREHRHKTGQYRTRRPAYHRGCARGMVLSFNMEGTRVRDTVLRLLLYLLQTYWTSACYRRGLRWYDEHSVIPHGLGQYQKTCAMTTKDTIPVGTCQYILEGASG